MKYLFTSLCILFATIQNISCNKIFPSACDNPDIAIYFTGFDSTELSSALIKKYDKNGFSNLVDSNISITELQHSINADNNWLIIFPSTKRTYFLRDINYVKVKNKMAHKRCLNRLNYTLNDAQYTISDQQYLDDHGNAAEIEIKK